MLELKINETSKAVNINGVALSKKHLHACFPGASSIKVAVFNYLAIVPFLATKFDEIKSRLKGHTLYGAIKAKRLLKVLNLTEDHFMEFMTYCMREAGDMPHMGFIEVTADNVDEKVAEIDDPDARALIEKIVKTVKDHNAVSGKKPTLH